MKVVPPDDEGLRVSRPGALSCDALIDLVERMLRVDGTETEHRALVRRFEESVPRPGASESIYWPERRADGAPRELSAAEIVDSATRRRAPRRQRSQARRPAGSTIARSRTDCRAGRFQSFCRVAEWVRSTKRHL